MHSLFAATFFEPSLLTNSAFYHAVSLAAASAVGGLFSAAWQGVLLAACVMLCLRALPGLSAAARSMVWMIVFTALVLLHAAPLLVSHATMVVARPAAFQLGVGWSIGIAAVWAALSLLRLGQLFASALRLHGLARRSQPVDLSGTAVGPTIDPLLRVVVSGKTVRRALLCTSSEVERPSVFGFFHPRILMPPALLERLSASELEQVVRHEMEHLRRADDWTNLAQKLALVVFPLNPALLWVEHRLCAERELACDDSVLKSSCGRKAYAICLTHLAEYTMLRRSLSLALGAWERQSELVRRVHRILRRPGKQMSGRRTLALTGGLAAAVLACAAGLARSPQLVSFNDPATNDSATTIAAAKPDLVATPHFHELRAIAQAGQAHNSFGDARMVNAIMPMGSQQSSPHVKMARRVSVRRAERQTDITVQQSWVVMTAWSADDTPQVVFTVSHTSRIVDGRAFVEASNADAMHEAPVATESNAAQARINGQRRQSAAGPSAADARAIEGPQYAAVPFADGWLIVRI